MTKKITIVCDDDMADALLPDLQADEAIEVEVEDIVWWVHKMEISQAYGGPEEGGWWYDQKTPLEIDDDYRGPLGPFNSEDDASAVCLAMNESEYARRRELSVGYTSVLSRMETFYSWTISDSKVSVPSPTHRPHYE